MGQTLQGAIDFFGGEELPFLDDTHWSAHPNIALALSGIGVGARQGGVLDSRIMNQDGRTIAARRSLFVAILIAAVLIGARVPAAPLAAAKPGHVARPKLVVLIVVDQMRADYLDQVRRDFSRRIHAIDEAGARGSRMLLILTPRL